MQSNLFSPKGPAARNSINLAKPPAT